MRSKDPDAFVILWSLAAIVSVAVILLIYWANVSVAFGGKSDLQGQFGDSFGALNAAVSFLGMVAIVATLIHQYLTTKHDRQLQIDIAKAELAKSMLEIEYKHLNSKHQIELGAKGLRNGDGKTIILNSADDAAITHSTSLKYRKLLAKNILEDRELDGLVIGHLRISNPLQPQHLTNTSLRCFLETINRVLHYRALINNILLDDFHPVSRPPNEEDSLCNSN